MGYRYYSSRATNETYCMAKKRYFRVRTGLLGDAERDPPKRAMSPRFWTSKARTTESGRGPNFGRVYTRPPARSREREKRPRQKVKNIPMCKPNAISTYQEVDLFGLLLVVVVVVAVVDVVVAICVCGG